MVCITEVQLGSTLVKCLLGSRIPPNSEFTRLSPIPQFPERRETSAELTLGSGSYVSMDERYRGAASPGEPQDQAGLG